MPRSTEALDGSQGRDFRVQSHRGRGWGKRAAGHVEMGSWHRDVTEGDIPASISVSFPENVSCQKTYPLCAHSLSPCFEQTKELWLIRVNRGCMQLRGSGMVHRAGGMWRDLKGQKTSPGRSRVGRACQVDGVGDTKAQRMVWIAGDRCPCARVVGDGARKAWWPEARRGLQHWGATLCSQITTLPALSLCFHPCLWFPQCRLFSATWAAILLTFLSAFLTLCPPLGKLCLSLLPGEFLLILQDPTQMPAPPCSLLWLLWSVQITPCAGTPHWEACDAVGHSLGACFKVEVVTIWDLLLPPTAWGTTSISSSIRGKNCCKEFWVAINRINQMTCVMPTAEPGMEEMLREG